MISSPRSVASVDGGGGGGRKKKRGGEERGSHYLVPARSVRDILHVAMNIVHRVGHCRNVLLGRTGAGRVVNFVRHVFGVFCRSKD